MHILNTSSNFIYDQNHNLILDNENNYIVGDTIVINGEKEYEVTFIDEENNIAYAEYNGSYSNDNFSSRYKTNLIVFSTIFITILFVVFSLLLFYKLKLKRKRKHALKHH